ncbi:hypothetical protein L5F32_06820 [Aliarcobacter butzleri]|uniref:hypothetical protein n=1 Tax=Aliarcobacter butzleri TaxID=28197 RepID=UPI001EDC6B98|nr:hypothetical protein [Aliarcobacter butzleri]MCG3651982.1 hypothetical protein [Aliarcobacter butzleri]
MSKIIYVKSTFQQQATDVVLFVCPAFIEIETQDETKHQNYILNLAQEDIYNEKLEVCLNARKSEYSKLNQDELRYDDQINGTTIWIDTIREIKEKFPKPEMV